MYITEPTPPARTRPDLPLDLAAAFHAAYDLSIRPGSIHYEETPPEFEQVERLMRFVKARIRAAAQRP